MSTHPRKALRPTIVERVPGPFGTVIRVLSCGHRVKEPSGGRARYAERAKCKRCEAIAGRSAKTAEEEERKP